MREISIARHQLANGLQVVLSPDDTVPIVAVNIGYRVGSRHEEPSRTGFAHLFEHLMFQGSANVAKGEHGAYIEAAGGRWNAWTWMDLTSFHETLPSHQLELAIWLEAERLTNLLPAMTQEKLDNQRDVVRNERRENHDNQPYGSWDERLHRLIYPAGHPYQHATIGSMADLAAASMDDVAGFFAAHYAPNNAVLVVAGDFESDRALDLLNRHFGPIAANPTVPPGPAMAIPEVIGRAIREVVPDDVELARVYVAQRIPPWGTAGFEPFDVCSDLLATGRSSRLYRRLVRERRLAQDVGALVFPFAFGAAVFVAWATARKGIDARSLEDALTVELDALGAAGPADEELVRARILHRTSVTTALEEAMERADRLMISAALFDDPERVNTELNRYDAVTGTGIIAAWKRYGRRDNRVVLTFIPMVDDPR